ncbi:type I CRISPR-associated protein Cas7, partial [Natronococcus sp. A-GB1]|uniref:type I CRISPR-associated protein Cas7 n=1 Tax=Natronococcus sp. A-GB1 TaxID=3037648 RepID=UPI0024200488
FTEYRVDYALMRFHGVINEHNAAETHLTQTDVELLEDGLWYGTRSETHTASKKGHEPRLLVRVEYETDDYHIGDLHRSFTYEPDGVEERAMRDITDGIVNATEFVTLIDSHADDIGSISIRASRRLRIRLSDGGAEDEITDLKQTLTDVLGSEHVSFVIE